MTDFRKGDRVVLSEHGLKAHRTLRKQASRPGTVVRLTAQEQVVVHWDGLKTGQVIAPKFIKRIEP